MCVDCPEDDERDTVEDTEPPRRLLLSELLERDRLVKRALRKAPTTCMGVLRPRSSFR